MAFIESMNPILTGAYSMIMMIKLYQMIFGENHGDGKPPETLVHKMYECKA